MLEEPHSWATGEEPESDAAPAAEEPAKESAAGELQYAAPELRSVTGRWHHRHGRMDRPQPA